MHASVLKVMAATIGATAVAVMGAMTIAVSGTSLAEPHPPGPIETPEATTGETVTMETAAPREPATLRATPEITGPAPLPEEEQGLPGD